MVHISSWWVVVYVFQAKISFVVCVNFLLKMSHKNENMVTMMIFDIVWHIKASSSGLWLVALCKHATDTWRSPRKKNYCFKQSSHCFLLSNTFFNFNFNRDEIPQLSRPWFDSCKSPMMRFFFFVHFSNVYWFFLPSEKIKNTIIKFFNVSKSDWWCWGTHMLNIF